MTNSQLKNLRLAVGITQEKLASRLGKLRGWIAHVEQGRISVTPQDQQAWVEASRYGTVATVTVTHQVLYCPGCGKPMYDDPPGLGLFMMCRCGYWSKAMNDSKEARSS